MIIVGLLCPINVRAETNEETQIKYTDTLSEALHRPSDEVIEKLSSAFAIAQSRIALKNYAKNLSCVAFAKSYLGIFGTWGNGGRYLSLNSTGQINDVLIFKYIHVAVVIGRVGEILTIREANWDNHGSIRTREISAFDSSILGFHKF